ncbi:hypothetical protein GOBAR_DD18353 [Gossypium barbadense]|nr:hypothetical protein GOBAR_DD18353 [Gossypium barbadense]
MEFAIGSNSSSSNSGIGRATKKVRRHVDQPLKSEDPTVDRNGQIILQDRIREKKMETSLVIKLLGGNIRFNALFNKAKRELSVRRDEVVAKDMEARVSVGKGKSKSKGKGIGVVSGLKVARQALKSSNGSSRGSKGKENRPFIFCGYVLGDFDPESSLASKVRFQQSKPPNGALNNSENNMIEVRVAMEEIVGAVDSIVAHNNSDEHLASCNKKRDANCGGNVVISS